jgi:hypothetical protein
MGTSTPTADEITRIREDLSAVEDNYTDGQITVLWASASAARDAETQHEATLYLMVKREIGRAINSIDYAAGNTSEKLSQKIGNLKTLLSLYQAAYDRVFGHRRAIAIGSMRVAQNPPEVPFDERSDEI